MDLPEQNEGKHSVLVPVWRDHLWPLYSGKVEMCYKKETIFIIFLLSRERRRQLFLNIRRDLKVNIERQSPFMLNGYSTEWCVHSDQVCIPQIQRHDDSNLLSDNQGRFDAD